MNLSGLLPLLREVPAYRELQEALGSGEGEKRMVVLEAARPYLLACLHRDLGLPLLVLTAQVERARSLREELLAWLGAEAPIYLFPEPDALPYERLAWDLATVQERLRALLALRGRGEGPSPLVIASVGAALGKTLSPERFASACHRLQEGMAFDLGSMLNRWLGLGYEVSSPVEVPGSLGRRGGIIDIYPPTSDLPVRIELFGNKVESLRLFDPESQRSLRPIPSVLITPAREVLPQDGGDPLRGLDLSSLRDEAREALQEDLARLSSGGSCNGPEFYSPLFNGSALPDYLLQGSLLVLEELDLLEIEVGEREGQAEQMRRSQVERGELPWNFPRPYFTWEEFRGRCSHLRGLHLGSWAVGEHSRLPLSPAPAYGGKVGEMLSEVKEGRQRGGRVIIVSQQAPRLAELFQEQDLMVFPSSGVGSAPAPGSVALVQGSLSGGWALGEATLLSDVEVFGFAKKRRLERKRPVRRLLLSDLEVGQYVVHIEHGIARFAGVTKRALEDGEREYLVLEYAAGDRLYVPADQVERVGRYIGPGDYLPTLTRLGTQEWARAKKRVREAVGDLARELLSLYAAREVLPGFAFSPDTLWQQEMEASFSYMETPDQLEAVREVKGDMEQPKPMDRLVCGDVGYGKTEVALRAAFKAVMDGQQVAALVPTTVLAQQHYATFRERLGAFPVVVEVLSRFRSDREQRAVLEGLARGSVDICIGTHRLLQRDVSFKNLGLVIIDEEQRFGVAHKERLKQMRREVDVLTLSATPIPRTLHMSLVGVRDMSTMETPPEERLPIKTYVAPHEEWLLREAILRELERGGQVFFVHNRVQSIAQVAARLSFLMPEAEVAIAHGQMPEEKLERVMLDFAAGKADVLVCTTIIESGLDLPNVNTLIVNDAHKLGLAQLYQLRGRVGRGASRAYAYFLFPGGKTLTEAAVKRLKTIFEATELGAGFRIAMKDLEIRGAGNLLGPEQSGHIGAVGFDLYSRLLAEAVEALKAEKAGLKPSKTPQPLTLDLPLSAYLPEEYVEEVKVRLGLYQRLARISRLEEVEEMARELRDRFGEMPRPASHLFYLLNIKVLAAQAGVSSVAREGGQIVVKMAGERRPPLEGHFTGVKVGHSQVRLDLGRLGGEWPKVLEGVLKRMAQAKDTVLLQRGS